MYSVVHMHHQSTSSSPTSGDVETIHSSSMSATPELTNKERRMARKAERKKEREELETKKTQMDSYEKASKKRAKEETLTTHASSSLDSNEHSGMEHKDNNENAQEDKTEDVEAMSHKERRKRRKMEKQAAASASQSGESSAPIPSRPQRSAYSVWIGNLAFSTSADDLTEWLQDQGIEGISRVHMTSGARKFEHNKGYVRDRKFSDSYILDSHMSICLRKIRLSGVWHFPNRSSGGGIY